MGSWSLGLDWEGTWGWFRSDILRSWGSCGIPGVSHVEFLVCPMWNSWCVPCGTPGVSHVEFPFFSWVSHEEFSVHACVFHAEFPVYPDVSHVEFPVYPSISHVEFPFFSCVSNVEFPVYPGVSHVEFPMFPSVSHVEFLVYPDVSHAEFPYPGVSRVEFPVFPSVSHVKFPMFPRFLEAERPRLSKASRTLAFVYPYIFDSIPVFYRLSRCVSGGCSEGSLPLHSRHSLCALLTFLSFTSRLPERLAPGSFDLVGHSHQVFHVCGILGTLFQLEAVSMDMAERRGRLPLPSSLETFGSLGMGAAASLAILGICFRSLHPEPHSREKSH
uniref:Progestin and adipoQ receptor family member 5 n=1 Tax=Zosterops lateralis melanops TaxID=1220523 RepID=A0A8D2PT20_ZOSLA